MSSRPPGLRALGAARRSGRTIRFICCGNFVSVSAGRHRAASSGIGLVVTAPSHTSTLSVKPVGGGGPGGSTIARSFRSLSFREKELSLVLKEPLLWPRSSLWAFRQAHRPLHSPPRRLRKQRVSGVRLCSVQSTQQPSSQPARRRTPRKVTQWNGNQQTKKARTTAATVHNTRSSPRPPPDTGVGGRSVLLLSLDSGDLKDGMLVACILTSPVSASRCLPIAP
ncbi:hypothetical protein EYF80_061189 [Liparis tanakae]|uniref:Uncharacterized protein n=1 Tax=Liparis tanakae TaxID=230148 RepID=A0A4Z2EJ59_9TELE|nr:hypothetical protein EYF80_061189 [Liparis tanakae]